MSYQTDVVTDARLRQAERKLTEAHLQAAALQKAAASGDRFRGLSRPVLEATATMNLYLDHSGRYVCAFRSLGCEATSGGVPPLVLDECDWHERHAPLCPVTMARRLLALPSDLQGIVELAREIEEAHGAGDQG
jgi:hypothetical protein